MRLSETVKYYKSSERHLPRLISLAFFATSFLLACQGQEPPVRDDSKIAYATSERHRADAFDSEKKPRDEPNDNEFESQPIQEIKNIIEGACKKNHIIGRLAKPQPNQVFQRGPDNTARIPIQLTVATDAGQGFFQSRLLSSNGSLIKPWTKVNGNHSPGVVFNSFIIANPGLYALEVRYVNESTEACESVRVANVGVGEVFITAGQSNSTNAGNVKLSPQSGMVFATDLSTWKIAQDPQPIATGAGGSPWPILGDMLAKHLSMPVGFVSIGWGATHVALWLPGASGQTAFGAFSPNQLFGRFESAVNGLGLNGARAVLWHQGESDTMLGTLRDPYASSLKSLILKSREKAGYPLSWYVAIASYAGATTQNQRCPNHDRVCLAELYKTALAQDDVIKSGIPNVFRGPVTDDIKGSATRYDDLHFNEAGLREHARRWFDALKPQLPQ
jgi:hypothetical protein